MKIKAKALFPDDVESIIISRNDYDRLYGELTYISIKLQQRIEKAIDYIEQEDWGTDYDKNLLSILRGEIDVKD